MAKVTRFSAESMSGILLLLAAAIALFLDNSVFRELYDRLLGVPFEVRLGEAALAKPLLLWINDGLMAVFFLLVGLEIKREVSVGSLSSVRSVMLPAMAALGGIVVPCAIFAGLNWGQASLDGWAIPAATDIAFALGILALLGPRVPVSLRLFLMAVAIVDDLAAVLIIAVFYTQDLSVTSIALAGVCTVVLFALNRSRVSSLAPYFLVGAVLWVCVLKSGVHATLAGVVLAFAIPMRARDGSSPVENLEHGLKPWVLFLVMPVFAFANAGVALSGLTWNALLAPLPLGILLGLFVGKQVGVFCFTWLAIKLGWARRPAGTTWAHIYGASLLAGVGFTMSLFIGSLAFSDAEHATAVRLGVLSGSLLSGLAGVGVLLWSTRRPLHGGAAAAESGAAGAAPAPSAQGGP